MLLICRKRKDVMRCALQMLCAEEEEVRCAAGARRYAYVYARVMRYAL